MDAAHHLARQIVEGRDIKLEGREGDADPVGERAPPARAKTFRKTVLEIVELDLDGRFRGALCLQHRYVPNRPALIALAPRIQTVMPGLVPGIHDLSRLALERGCVGQAP